MTILKTKDISYSYDKQKHLLKTINIEFEAGKVYAILGPSGCGKTTLLSLLGGLDEPTEGAILFEGVDIAKQVLAHHRKNNVAFIFQNYNLIDYLTPAENVRLTSTISPYQILNKLGLTNDECNRNVMKLSGGQQQRVAIGRALASNAQLILADEPTGNLDEDTAKEIATLLKNSAHEAGKCVIIVTHSHQLAQDADYIIKLRKGRVELRKS